MSALPVSTVLTADNGKQTQAGNNHQHQKETRNTTQSRQTCQTTPYTPASTSLVECAAGFHWELHLAGAGFRPDLEFGSRLPGLFRVVVVTAFVFCSSM